MFSASKRVDRETRSLLFEDEVFCNIEKRKVNRKLTVAFSSQYGRPTVHDDMLLVALMKKTRDLGFESQRVHFSRYELIKLLAWPNNGQSYDRIDEGFNRLIGTHLVWDNAFWDNDARSWVDRKFSIVDDTHLYDREKYQRALATANASPKSWFKWSDVMFESFQAGYIKTIDLQKLNSLNEIVGRRLYRWLDKHFNNPNRRLPVEINLGSLAKQKLGFKPAAAGHLKRMIQPAISELEQKQILATDRNRFQGKGKSCTVRFRPYEKTTRSVSNPNVRTTGSLEEQLVEFGIPKRTAVKLVGNQKDVVAKQLEHLKFLKDSGRNIKSDAAWLISAVKNDFALPKGFKTSSMKFAAKKQADLATKKYESQKRRQELTRVKRLQESTSRVTEYLNTLSQQERKSLQQLAIGEGSQFLVSQMNRAERNGDPQIASIYREKMVAELVHSILKKRSM